MDTKQPTEIEKQFVKFFKDEELLHSYRSRASNFRNKFCKAGLLRRETFFAAGHGRTSFHDHFTSCWATEKGYAVLDAAKAFSRVQNLYPTLIPPKG